METHLITDEKLDLALNYLADTDEQCAELKAGVARTEFLAKVAESMCFNALEGGAEVRKHGARVQPETTTAWEKHFAAIKAYETVRAKRERAILLVSVWQSVGANRRAAA